jgi:hypothetical protein
VRRIFTSINELPLAMRAPDLAAALNVSRPMGFKIMHSEGFPSRRIGKCLIVMKDDFLNWLEDSKDIEIKLEEVTA